MKELREALEESLEETPGLGNKEEDKQKADKKKGIIKPGEKIKF